MISRIIFTGVREMLPMVRTGDPNRHISAIIRSLCLKLGHFEDDNATATPEELAQRQTRFELGNAFEDAVIAAMVERYIKTDPNRYCRIGELEKDGLIGTPDLLDISAWAIVEVKLTWLSSRNDFDSEKFWRYKVQMMAYCQMVETRLAYLHSCHLNGDYRGDRGPTYNVHECVFTRQELDNNWYMLRTHSDALLKR